MKHYSKLAMALVALFTLSCSQETVISEPPAIRLDISMQGFSAADPVSKISTKTSESGYTTSFTDGDTVGVAVTIAGVFTNSAYELQGGVWRHVASTPVLPLDNSATYSIYYPYADLPTDWDVFLWTISNLPEDQSSYEKYAAGDRMYNEATLSSGTTLSTQLHRAWTYRTLIEIELPAGASSPVIRYNSNTNYIPWNTSGQTYRCMVLSGDDHDLSGTYLYENTTFEWYRGVPSVSSGYYYHFDISNEANLRQAKVVYADGSEETVLIGTQSKRIQYTPNTGKVIQQVEVSGKTHLIGRSTDSGPIELNLDSNGDISFRPADFNGDIPIGSYAEFQLIRTATGGLAGQYRQEADLDLMGSAALPWTPIGTNSNKFTGTFDGDNKSIDNLYINVPGPMGVCLGLFGYAGATCKLENIHVMSGSVVALSNVGGVVGYLDGGNITGCSFHGSLTAGDIGAGGVVGYNNNGTIKDCYNTGSIIVTILMIAGGVVGNNQGTMTGCYNTGNVSGPSSVGGVAGINSGDITACYNTGNVSGFATVGGVVGGNIGNVTACYNTGNVSGTGSPVGGVVAQNSDGNITACYNAGNVSGSSIVGGVVGRYISGNITACYWLSLSGSAANGIGSTASNADAEPFGSSSWPEAATHQQWGTGNGSGNGLYWKSRGNWVGGDEGIHSNFPKLWFE